MDNLLPKKTEGYQVHSIEEDLLEGSIGKRWSNLVSDFSGKKGWRSSFSLQSAGPRAGISFSPDNRIYRSWWLFMMVMCVLSSMFTPFQFGFFRGLPRALWIIDLCVQVPFIIDLILQFFKAYKDKEMAQLVGDNRLIAVRYFKRDFIIELWNCLPWDAIYKGTGHHEAVRCLVWTRIYRIVKLAPLFNKLEKDIRFNYFAVRIVKLLVVEAFYTHAAACFYYYLATTVKTRSEGYTWIGALTLGTFSYSNFRMIDLGKRYVTSLYWAVVTLTTVGYGDIHAINIREMIFIMIYITFNMLLGAYLIGNMSALVVKGSATERFRDRMSSIIRYSNRHHLPHHIAKQLRNHILLQFETGRMKEDEIVEDLPESIRSKVANKIYSHIVRRVPLFKGCSTEFEEEIVSKVVEEHFLPGEIVVQQGGASDNFYIVCDGTLDELKIRPEDGTVEVIEHHSEGSVFGEVGVLCNIPQPFTVRVTERCRLLRLDKRSFSDLVHIYFNDGRLLINNLLEMKDTDRRIREIAADVTFLVAKQAAELALMVNNAAFQGDLVQLKALVKQGANIANVDYDGRSPLHLAAEKGYENIVLYLTREGANVNAVDAFGVTPLLEAVQNAHDECITVLLEHGAKFHMDDVGCYLCEAVNNGNNELLRRLLLVGADASAVDYDKRSALHIASVEGNLGLVKMLLEAGANVNAKDRWGQTPLDEAKQRQHGSIVQLLKDDAPKKKPS